MLSGEVVFVCLFVPSALVLLVPSPSYSTKMTPKVLEGIQLR